MGWKEAEVEFTEDRKDREDRRAWACRIRRGDWVERSHHEGHTKRVILAH